MSRPAQISDLPIIEVPSEPVLSPAGGRVVYTLRREDLESDRSLTRLWTVALDGDPTPRPLTNGPDDSGAVFSPDGTRIAFLRDGVPWMLRLDGGEPEPVARETSFPHGASALAWSPDGTRLAVAADAEPDARPTRCPTDHGPEQASAPIEVRLLGDLRDGIGYVPRLRQQLFCVSMSTGAVWRIAGSEFGIGSFAWSPDSSEIAYTASPPGAEELDMRSAVHCVPVSADDDATASEQARVLAFETGHAVTVSYSPDGGALVVLGYPGEPRGHACIYVVDRDTGEVTRIAPELDRNAEPGDEDAGGVPVLLSSGEVLFSVSDAGRAQLYVASASGSPARVVPATTGIRTVSGFSCAGHGVVAVVAAAQSFGEVTYIDMRTPDSSVELTNHGASHSHVDLLSPQRRVFEISDGHRIDAWVIRDPSIRGEGPLLLDVHGGPQYAWNGIAHPSYLYHQELAARGWTVLLLNPRGSDGYGEACWTAVNGAWGEADLNDFLEPLDELVAEGIADPDRLVLSGYSYGGFMSCNLPGRDPRFAAAIAGGPISDLISVAGTASNAFVTSRYELELFPWRPEDRKRLWELSPLSRAERVRTPTLLLQGAADTACPIGQSQQWLQALQEQGVPSEMVVYPGAGHAFIFEGRPSHRIDYARRIVEWAERWAGPVEMVDAG
ncbi:S9 family peptidase [Leucobacter iarius]|uniref:Peptidase S9 prolyl oligopeptidase catalytic domain-containing protein n=1 Tax=Leucobacter iarius TaxID=333963 RepID=A0ABN2LMF4_9MICO